MIELNTEVKHEKWGRGKVVEIINERIFSVEFSDINKQLIYPDSFLMGLSVEDDNFMKQAKEDYNQKIETKKFEEEQKRKEMENKEDLIEINNSRKSRNSIDGKMTQIEALKEFVNQNIGRIKTVEQITEGVSKIYGEKVDDILARGYRYNVKAKGDCDNLSLFYYVDRNQYLCLGENVENYKEMAKKYLGRK